MFLSTMYTPINPQMAPVMAAASRPLRKNSYCRGSNRVSIAVLLKAAALGVVCPRIRTVGNEQQPVLPNYDHLGVVRSAQNLRRKNILRVSLRHNRTIKTDHPR